MKQKEIFGGLAILFLVAILFMPKGSDAWAYLMILGIIFGVGWIVKG